MAIKSVQDLADTMPAFEEIIPLLPASDRQFAISLRDSYLRYKNLTARQLYWVEQLMNRAKRGSQPVPAAQVVGIQRIRRMFDTAAKRLKFPKIWLGTESQPIRLSIAGPASRYHGSIMVTDGRPYGQNYFYGSIDRAGVLKPGRDLTTEVAKELSELDADPESKAAAFGRMSGHCCFCNTALTDERSVSVGYGPVCAENFGLAWGKKAAKQAAAEQVAA